MALTAEESSVPQQSVVTSCGLEDSSAPLRTSTPQSEAGVDGLKTVQILKEWPVVTETVNKAQQLYESLKTKSRIFNWSCALAEKSVHAVYQRSAEFLPVLNPAIRLADFAASEVAEAVQKQLPLVRQPTSQVSDTVRSGFSSLFVPLSASIGSVLRIGKGRTRSATKRVVRTYKELMVTVDKWMDEVEKYIDGLESKEVRVSQEQTQRVGARSLRGRALDAAATAALLYVGACCWLLSRLPVVGAFLQRQTPSPSPSKSASPLREPEPQSSRSAQPSTESSVEADIAEVIQELRAKRQLESEAFFQKGTV